MSAINLSPFPFFALVSLLFTSISSEGQELGDTVSQAGLFSYQAPKACWECCSGSGCFFVGFRINHAHLGYPRGIGYSYDGGNTTAAMSVAVGRAQRTLRT